MDEATLERSRASFQQLLARWRETLTGAHPNAVWIQLDRLTLDEAWFKFVIRLRERASSPPVNDHLWDLFLTGYGVKQSLGIRRLTDPKPGTGSLMGIVLAMERNAPRFTRNVVVGDHGFSMDVDVLRRQILAATDAEDEQLAVQRWSDARHAHENFDRLRDVDPSTPRQPDDSVSDRVWISLKGALSSEAIQRVRHQCNKYLAHADLSDLSKGLATPTYNDIHESIRALVHVDHFLRSTFFNHSSSVLPTYQGNAREYLSMPLVPPLPQDIYEEEWGRIRDEIEQWGKVSDFRRFAIHPDFDARNERKRTFEPGPRIVR